ncbi:hypothetical protein J3A64_000154 [Pseudarthrobacter sp. PvP004]|uniref:hypothetical protein n=1 Tax=Pseudarthrobacter sp. PvP004 TaxID=2817850 RepID=UPI00257045E0|nr:hypothetical protein [Pseudarthrobacter sp. PvP004]MBP2264690.1 hypothetical protein [Pseudarthrobacter sp. PvP004]
MTVTYSWGIGMKALAATFLLTSLALTGCAVTVPGGPPTASTAPSPPSGAKTYAGLDPAGIEQIKTSRTAIFDMKFGTLTKESVGLEDGTNQAPDVLMSDGVMELKIEAPTGLIRAETDRLRLNGMNSGPEFREITYFLKTESLKDFIALIRDGVDRYGIPSESAEDWIESVSSRPEDKSDFALAPGTSTGLRVQYDLRYDGSKDVQVIIVHVHPV